MDHNNLGRSNMGVSKICLGTMHFGPKASEEESHQILDRALQMGINFIDTANVYGGDAGRGRSEEIIGSWLAARPEVRDEIVLATKVYNPMGDLGIAREERGFSAYKVRKHLADSGVRHRPGPGQHSVQRLLGIVRRDRRTRACGGHRLGVAASGGGLRHRRCPHRRAAGRARSSGCLGPRGFGDASAGRDLRYQQGSQDRPWPVAARTRLVTQPCRKLSGERHGRITSGRQE